MTTPLLLALIILILDWTSKAPDAVVPLQGETFHVQGIALDGATIWISSTDRSHARAWLFQYDRKTGHRLRSKDLTDGPRSHPGGIMLDGQSLWIPVAEPHNSGTTNLLQINTKTLAPVSRFEAPDHIGALAVTADRLIGVNWDARQIYEWRRTDGELIRKRNNPTAGRYQDMKVRAGRLILSGLEGPAGVVRSIEHLETLEILHEIRFGKTDRGVVITNEGMDLDENGTLYFLPEDTPSRLFVFHRSQLTSQREPTR